MKGMLLNQWYHFRGMLKYYLGFLSVYLLICVTGFQTSLFQNLAVLYLIAFCGWLFAQEGEQGWEAYANTLPVDAHAPVKMQYLSHIMVLAVSVGIGVIFQQAAQGILANLYVGMLQWLRERFDMVPFGYSWAGYSLYTAIGIGAQFLCFASVFLALILPVYDRLERRGRKAAALCGATLFAWIYLTWAKLWFSWEMVKPGALLLTGMAAGAALILSYFVSCLVYRKKDF